jgi:hypothetical protein
VGNTNGTNGTHPKGRAVPAKPKFTFKSGITVTMERVGPLLGMAIRKNHPPPQPPTQRVEVGPGEWKEVPNPQDPDYLVALTLHQADINGRITDATLDVGIGDDLEIDTAAVARLRRVMERRGSPIPAEEDDRIVYIKYMVVTDGADIGRFQRALAAYESPDEEAIRAAEDLFRGDVSGDADPERAVAILGDTAQ